MSRKRRHTCLFAGTVLVVGTALLLAGSAVAQTVSPDLERLMSGLRGFHYGPDRSALDAVAQTVREAVRSPQQRPQVARALMDVALSPAAEEARQFACRQLVYIAGLEQVPSLLKLLHDDAMAHYALMVLARIPGRAVDHAMRQALGHLEGKTLLGAVDLLGERQDPASARAVAVYARSADNALAACAMTALARIGTSEADVLLLAEYRRSPPARKALFADALLLRADALRQAGRRADAARFYTAVDAASLPETYRAAAWRGKLLLQGDAGADALIAAMAGPASRRRSVAASLARTLGTAVTTRKLAGALPRLQPDSARLLLDALADRGDRTAVPGVLRMLKSRDERVRASAIRALGTLGGAQAVEQLLAVAADASASQRSLADQALAGLRGKGVDAMLARALSNRKASIQAAALRALTARRGDMPMDRVLALARSGQGALFAAAVEALRELGRPTDLEQVLQMVLRRQEADRDRLGAAWLAIARRCPPERSSSLLEEQLRKAGSQQERVVLLELAGQLGGERALALLISAARDPDPEIQLTALRALSEWPDARPMAILRETVRAKPSGRLRSIAMRGYVRSLGLPGGPDPMRAADLYLEALGMAVNADEKRMVLAGMATVGDRRVLETVMSLTGSSDLRAEAEQAAFSICRLTAGAWPDETRSALQKLAADASLTEVRQGSRTLLNTMDRFGDYVMAWEVSPAYSQEGADFSRLFDVPFAPEDPTLEAGAGWRVMPVGTSAEQPWLLDLLALHGGEQRVAYLRTAVWSDAEKDLVAEIGTDDGVKVWWNGEYVYGNNTQRAVAPSQEKVRVHARQGWNRMLLKVTQNIMGWGACVRFAATDGSPATGLRYSLPSSLPNGER